MHMRTHKYVHLCTHEHTQTALIYVHIKVYVELLYYALFTKQYRFVRFNLFHI